MTLTIASSIRNLGARGAFREASMRRAEFEEQNPDQTFRNVVEIDESGAEVWS